MLSLPTARYLAAALVAVALVAPQASSAQDADGFIDSFEHWSAFKVAVEGQPLCYMASAPETEEGDYTRRGDTYVFVTHRPAEGALNVVQVVAGYTYREHSEVTLTIGRETFTLFTSGSSAWARDAETDARIVRALKAGLSMVVTGTSSRGTLTTDTYSLRGATAAYAAVSRACGVKGM